METQLELYRACGRYVQDQAGVLGDLHVKIEGYLRSRHVKSLATLSELIDWNSHSVETIMAIRQIEAFFKKNAAFSDESSCMQAAHDAFHKAEGVCAQVNSRLDHLYFNRDLIDPDVELMIRRAERYIRKTLGHSGTFLESLPRLVKFTNGASSTRSRRNSEAHRKVRLNAPCTRRAEPYLRAIAKYFGYNSTGFKLVSTNRVEVVPKNWKTHRTIACEPEGNISLQLAGDLYIKDRLRNRGIDLGDQFRNQDLARRGSIDGSYATIDLAAASDTISINTVAWLLPYEWFKILSDFRTPAYSGKFGSGVYHKFSSMGNGCTFTLETLIFASLCSATGSKGFSVYGDDIIIETEFVPALQKLLDFFGFSVNEEKSYTAGPFRESCGMDCYSGMEITPFYVRSLDRRKPMLCHVVNGLARIAKPGGSLWEFLRDYISEHKLPFVPANDSSMSGVWLDLRRSSPSQRTRVCPRTQQWQFRSYVSKAGSRYVGNVQTYFLWHLRAFQKADPRGPFAEDVLALEARWNAGVVPSRRKSPWWNDLPRSGESAQESWLCSQSHSFGRAWVTWREPGKATLDHMWHLPLWSDFLLRAS